MDQDPYPDGVIAAQVTRLCVHTLGVTLPLDVHGPSLAAAVELAWRDCLTTLPPDLPPLSVSLGSSGTPPGDVSGGDIPEALHRLSPAVTQQAIGARAGDLVMLHAAALADVDTGATAVLVAPSGTGKTTAATILGRHFAYLTDETAGIDRDGTVVPYPKPLSIIRSGHLKDQVAPSELGLLAVGRTCHVGAVLVLARDQGHTGAPMVSRLPTVDALAALAPEASFLGRLDLPLQRLAEVLDRAGGAHRVTYADAHTLEPTLRSLMGADR